MQPEDTALLDQVQAAFPPIEIPADDAFASWGRTYLDGPAYQAALKGKRWNELDAVYLALRSDALGFLGTHALIAVLPAYLLAIIEHGTSSPVAGMLTLVLAPPSRKADSGLGKKRFGELVEAMTGSQRAAVAAVLQRFGDKYPETLVGDAARAAFDRYWKSFLSSTGA